MSYGGYGNRGYDYHQRRERINEDEVPESKHTIFIRGLPGDMSTDEIREYFEDRIGPVSFDFVKTSADQQRLFVAVRFETRDDAKEAMSKYSENDLMGHRCELSWFKDIRRYAQYQSMNQGRRGRPVFRSRAYQHNGSRGGRDSNAKSIELIVEGFDIEVRIRRPGVLLTSRGIHSVTVLAQRSPRNRITCPHHLIFDNLAVRVRL
ncbi:unnamed protein product [Nippostrongylus brasiliensis]|uniref:RRM domain-containing protein n=2 Tax=Nippostrongylus brasiliensis TaxID=27835 RepID=A0A0N4YVR8_NIPBR|nr:unnamed protein product [Nippostrongylus brasiliensis]